MQPVLRSSNRLVFLSPSVDRADDGEIPARPFPLSYNVSFVMDGVESVRRTFAAFDLLPNPRLVPFRDDRKQYRGEILSLEVCLSFSPSSK